jgi:hypothetical protein
VHPLRSIHPDPLPSKPSGPARSKARWLTAILGALTTLSLTVPTLVHAETAPGSDPNNYQCAGQITAGKPEAGSEEQQVQYEFKCNGQITGYQLQTQIPVTGIEGAPLLTNFQSQPLNDSFSCSGSLPGYAVNCVGSSTSGPDERITGQFAIGWKICTEPRVDPLLSVTYAYPNERGVITQAISGPFDLGRPLGCPATAHSGKTRLSANQGPERPSSEKSNGKRHGKNGKTHRKAKGKAKAHAKSKSTGALKGKGRKGK